MAKKIICNLDAMMENVPPSQNTGLLNRIKTSLHSRYIQLLIAFTIAGFFLRFYNISYNSIWLDEAATLDFAKHSIIEIWGITAGGEFNPPLFHWIEHLMLVFGHSEFVLRFVPAFLGAFTVPLFYWVGKEIIDSNVGIIAAAILAFSPFHIFYSQDARAYTTVLFFFTLALIFYVKALRRPKRYYWVLFGLFSALAFWTHFYVFIPILGMYLYFIALPILEGKRIVFSDLKDALLSFGVFFIITLPLILVTVHLVIIRTGSSPTYGVQGISIITETISQMSGNHILLTGFLFVMFIVGMIEIWTQKRKCCVFIAWILALIFLSSYLLSYSMPMIPRHLISILPFYITGIAASYRLFYHLIPSQKVVYALICIFIVVSVPVLANYYTTYSKENWRAMGENLPAATHDGDTIVLMPGYLRMPFEYYYSQDSDKTQVYGASNLAELQDVLKKTPETNRTFFIMTGDIIATDPSQETVRWMESNTQNVGAGTGIYIFTIPKT